MYVDRSNLQKKSAEKEDETSDDRGRPGISAGAHANGALLAEGIDFVCVSVFHLAVVAGRIEVYPFPT